MVILQSYFPSYSYQQDKSTYYDCWITLQTAPKIATSNLYCNITLVWLDSSLSVHLQFNPFQVMNLYMHCDYGPSGDCKWPIWSLPNWLIHFKASKSPSAWKTLYYCHVCVLSIAHVKTYACSVTYASFFSHLAVRM